MNELRNKITATIAEYDMLARGDRVIVGVSGGADSVCLLSVLHELAGELGISLVVAHLNHGIRGAESDADEQFVCDLAGSLGVECICERISVPDIQQREGGSTEEIARRVRYEFYERAAEQAGASAVAMGHTRDDNAETVIQRILRGAGIRGLGGIPPKRPIRRSSDVMIVRPLIDACRREILDYLQQAGLSYRTDASNADVSYFRNRIRHNILPWLEEETGADVRDSLIRLAHAARNHYNLIEDLARDVLDRARRQPPAGVRLSLECEPLAGAHPEVLVEALRLAAEEAGAHQLTYDQTRQLPELMAAPTATEQTLPGGVLVRKDYDRLSFFVPEEMPDRTGETQLTIPGTARFLGRTFTAEVVELGPDDAEEFFATKTPREELLDFDAVSGPLTIRTRRPGDRFTPLGNPGSRKLQDFFVDEKVPALRRDRVPVVYDREGIVWVAGQRIDQRVRITAHTRKAVLIKMSQP